MIQPLLRKSVPAGFFVCIHQDGLPPSRSYVAACAQEMVHRGPDGLVMGAAGPFGWAQQNFHVTPYSVPLPYRHPHHDWWVLFDGRVDYRHELFDALGEDAPVKRFCPDAELIARAYGRWGHDWITHIRGSLCAVVIDLENRTVLACRDHLGKQPLVYSCVSGYLLLGSEPVALLRHPAIPKGLDDSWMANFFAFGVGNGKDHTPFSAVKQLLPGECLSWVAGKVRRWRPSSSLGQQTLRYRDEREYAEHFLRLLDQSLRNLTLGLGPIGVMLSGGMDSCPVACLASRALERPGQPVTAYSWSLPGFPESDETRQIEICARHAGLPLQLFSADKLCSVPRPAVWPLDPNTPQANPMALVFAAIYRRAAANGCRILLQGTFGDMLYPHQRYLLSEALVPGRLGLFGKELNHLVGRHGITGLHRQPAVRHLVKTLLHLRSRPQQPPPWLTASAARLLDFGAWPDEAQNCARPDQHVNLLGADVFEDHVGYGRQAYRHGLVRCDPYHDWYLIDFALSAPAYVFSRLGQTKYVAREAMRGRMPEELRSMPRVGLLGSFIEDGLGRSRAAMNDVLSTPGCTWDKYLDGGIVRRELAGEASSEMSQLITWQAFTYELWLKQLAAYGVTI